MISDGETGFLAGDEEEWFEHLSYILENPGDAKRIAERGREKIKAEYGLESTVQKVDNLLEGFR